MAISDEGENSRTLWPVHSVSRYNQQQCFPRYGTGPNFIRITFKKCFSRCYSNWQQGRWLCWDSSLPGPLGLSVAFTAMDATGRWQTYGESGCASWALSGHQAGMPFRQACVISPTLPVWTLRLTDVRGLLKSHLQQVAELEFRSSWYGHLKWILLLMEWSYHIFSSRNASKKT